MRNDHKKIALKKLPGKLYGVGIGPGDPKLITLKAKEILERVDVIFAPKGSDDGISYARSILESALSKPKPFVELTFPMTRNKQILKRCWRKSALRIMRDIKKGKQAAFITIGDPFIYSTYIYLLDTINKDFPRMDIETVPGISSFNAAASAACIPLAEGNERLAILPVRKGLDGLKQAFGMFDTVVLMKVGAKLDKVLGLLRQMKLLKSSILISRLGHPNERIVRGLSSIKDKKIGYLSVIIVRKGRSL